MKSSAPSVASGGLLRFMRIGIAGLACLFGVTTLGSGCLNRPVGEQSPRVSNIFVDQIAQTAVDKIDLLFMIDNSVSMQDKILTLQDAVPELLARLVTPNCVDDQGNWNNTRADQNGKCAQGDPEFKPIRDIHIGVVTSSLGGHGGNQCVPANDSDPVDDKAHLLALLPRSGNPAYAQPLGFLNWAPGKPGGESNPDALKANFADLIGKSGESGCGYESQLEAWYRFLIEPDPVKTVTWDQTQTRVHVERPDQEILTERKNFLRPDSLVAIVMLSDENDCSVMDTEGGIGALVAGAQVNNGTVTLGAPRATAACAADPNDKCCRTCAIGVDPAGCTPLAEDTECKKGPYFLPGDIQEDHPNLRCFQQKKRFGINLLWDPQRYVDGLTKTTITDGSGNPAPNPLFAAPEGTAPRSSKIVFLAGIIGVPWQDIATEDSLTDPNKLVYKDYALFTQGSGWDLVLGDASRNQEPKDGLMIESVDPRTGKANPVVATGGAIAPATSTNPKENVINGHEADYSSQRRDLQYACIYQLPDAFVKDCTNNKSCDCTPSANPLSDELQFNRPLCNPPGGGPAQSKQYFAKAYPGLRELQVLKGFGQATTNSILASICPKIIDPARKGEPAYGYTPAVAAIIDRLKGAFGGKCLSRQLNVENGVIPCKIVETIRLQGQTCGADGSPANGCDNSKGRSTVTAQLRNAVIQQLKNEAKVCGGEGLPACEEFCMCAIDPLTGDDATACQNAKKDSELEGAQTPGYCYVDPLPPPAGQGIGSLESISSCDPTEPHRLRFAGADTPVNGSVTFIACLGETGKQSTVTAPTSNDGG